MNLKCEEMCIRDRPLLHLHHKENLPSAPPYSLKLYSYSPSSSLTSIITPTLTSTLIIFSSSLLLFNLSFLDTQFSTISPLLLIIPLVLTSLTLSTIPSLFIFSFAPVSYTHLSTQRAI